MPTADSAAQPFSTEDLEALRRLLAKAAASTGNPSWRRTINEANHVAGLIHDDQHQPKALTVAEITDQLADVKRQLQERAGRAETTSPEDDTPPGERGGQPEAGEEM